MKEMQQTQENPNIITCPSLKKDSNAIKHVNLKNIAVSEQTYLRLLQKGKMRESFDKLLSRLIDETEDRIENKATVGSGLEARDQTVTSSSITACVGAVTKP